MAERYGGNSFAFRVIADLAAFCRHAMAPLLVLSVLPSITQAAPAEASPRGVFDETCAVAGARCGHLIRPLDPTGGVPGAIRIGFVLYPHRDVSKPPAGTIVAMEGGPGYPTSGTGEAYLELFAPLLADHDLLLVDNRGTGLSQPIDCHALQTMPVPTVSAVGACGRSLGDAADFYGSPLVADDLAAVLDALGIGAVDLYGDSYGTFTAQIFAFRHPDRVKRLVLDGAFPTYGESGFFPNTPTAIRRNLDRICARSAVCRALPGTPLERAERLVARLRRAPLHGAAPNSLGGRVAATVDPAAIGTILYDATYDPVNLREFDPAVRAMLDHDDPLPLLRLAAETGSHSDSRDPSGSAAVESYGLFAAVSCMDYPQLYDMTAAPARRRDQLEQAVAAKRRDEPDLYAPLTIDEWRGLPLDYSILDLCLDWPVHAPPYVPGAPVAKPHDTAAVPTLILSGEYDTTTPPEDAAMAAGAFPGARRVLLANSFHVDALGDEDECAAPIVRRFVASGDPGDMACIDRIPVVRPAADFARRIDDVMPATGERRRDLAAAAAAAATVADALARTWRVSGDTGLGLRGGTFAIERSGDRTRAKLDHVRWAEDLAVSGSAAWDRRSGRVDARLTLSGASDGTIVVNWNERDAEPRATVVGTVGGHPLSARIPAP
ncbi:MAG TPA: alpha/beta hydrolase [Alphaproteobacteria bacterium]|jgi:pimeloyl-ACP methyl ester carboxylesterase|nr:alpha/beta hydrolase [Alphaproteobacteria bacterium]